MQLKESPSCLYYLFSKVESKSIAFNKSCLVDGKLLLMNSPHTCAMSILFIPWFTLQVFIIGLDKKLKLQILYPATTGRNFE